MNETAWVIDNAGLYLGEMFGAPTWVSDTNQTVIHFEREQDAERVIRLIRFYANDSGYYVHAQPKRVSL